MARRELGPAALAVVQAVERIATAPLLVACSGGADSLALAAASAIVGRRRKLPVRAVVVDHGLQPGSEEVAARVVRQLAPLAVSVVTVRVEPAGEGLEAAARTARYRALESATAAGELVLLGHTLDDQAETVLLGLARGSGVRSLAGMPARRGPFVRPLLGLRRETTRAACAEHGLEPWDDPHNDAAGFARVRVRHRVLPVLEDELGPGVAEALARTADLARADADLLDDLAVRLRAGGDVRDLLPPARPSGHLDVGWLAELPQALRGRVVRRWLAEAGGRDLSATHVRAVLALVTDWHGQGPLDLPGVTVGRVSDAGAARLVRVPQSGGPPDPER
jgi:tRNA(Ile)-lysidine synthase